MIADQNQTVHAFTYQRLDQESSQSYRAIFYNRWTLEQGWTAPIDIILSPNKDARLTDAYLNSSGTAHLLFWGGDNTTADIYYSKALIQDAGDARAWSIPTIIGPNAGDPEGAAFVENSQGGLYVIYNGRELGNGLYAVHSDDRGESWSDPTPLFFTRNDEPNIAQLHVIRDTSGWMHAVWTVFNTDGQARGIYYIRSKDGDEWSDPVLLASAFEGLGTSLPMIVEYKSALYLNYFACPIVCRMNMRVSINHGETWDDPSLLFARHIGLNGSMSMVIDGNDVLHLFWGQRIPGQPDIHGMWHSEYRNSRWLEPEAVVKGPTIRKPGGEGFDPFQAQAVASQGNILLATWRTDPGLSSNGVWYSYKAIDAPALPVTELPSSIKSGTGESKIVHTPMGSTLPSVSLPEYIPENSPTLDSPADRASLQDDPSFVLLAGFIAAILLLLMLVISRGANRRK
jgi:hypothetical protein